MKNLPTTSIFRKSLTLVCTMSMLSVLLVTVVSTYRHYQDLLEDMRTNGLATALMIEKQILTAMDWKASFEEIGQEQTELISSIYLDGRFNQMLNHVGVITLEGTVLSHSAPAQIGQALPQFSQQDIAQNNRISVIARDSSYDVYIPVIHRNHKQGFIVVGFDNNVVDERILNTIFTSAAVTVLCLILAGIVFSLFVRFHISGPIQQILNSIQKIQDSQDLSIRIPITTRDEIGFLSEQFNRMMNGLESAKNAVEQLLKSYEKTIEGVREQEQETWELNVLIQDLLSNTHRSSRQVALAVNTCSRELAQSVISLELPQIIQETSGRCRSYLRKFRHSNPSALRNVQHFDTLFEIAQDISNAANGLGLMMEEINARGSKQISDGDPLEWGKSLLDADRPFKRQILIVEDDERQADLLQRYLTFRHYYVQTVPTAQQCLELLMKRSFQPDLIIVSVEIGGEISGLSLGEKLRSRQEYQLLPLLFTSIDPNNEAAVHRIGANGLLLKPLNIFNLHNIIWDTLHLFGQYDS